MGRLGREDAPKALRIRTSFYFAGDTGYSPDFRDIGARFGSFDLALIHASAVRQSCGSRAHFRREDVHAKKAIGIHWGSFELADDPPRLLADAVRQAGLSPDAFTMLEHGQMIRLDAK